MKNLTFVYRSGPNTRPLQERRDGFLFRGSIRIDDGFVVGADGSVTTYALIRPLAFRDPDQPQRTGLIDPGDYGIVRFGFNMGRINLRSATSSAIIVTSSPTHQFYSGRISVVALSNGSLTAFSIFGLNQEDPEDFYIESATDLDSGGVTQGWVRMNATFVPHRRARYIGVGAKVYAVPNTGQWRNQYFKKWMLEKRAVGTSGPSAGYSPAREVRVTMRPHRTLAAVEIADQTPVVERILEDNVPLGIGIADPTWVNP